MSIGQLFALHRSSYSAWSPLTLEPVYRASFGRIWSLRGVSATPISSWSSRRWTLREAFIRRHTHGVSEYVWVSLKSKYSARWRAGSKIKSSWCVGMQKCTPRAKSGAARVISGSALWAPFPSASFGSRTSTSPREENPAQGSARARTRWAAGLTV